MTIQSKDLITRCGQNVGLHLLRPESLFDPKKLGLEPEMMNTACYRGFYCTYDLTDRGFYLAKLTIRTDGDIYPAIHGVCGSSDSTHGAYVYDGLKIPISYTGTIIIGTRAIARFAEAFGLPDPYSYTKVFQIELQKGRPKSAKEIEEGKDPPWCIFY